MVILNAGELDQRLQLLEPTITKDPLGQRVSTFAPVVTVAAKLLSLVSREAAMAGAIEGRATTAFRIRFRADVQRTWRVQWRGQEFELVGDPIDVKGARVALDLMCVTAPVAP